MMNLDSLTIQELLTLNERVVDTINLKRRQEALKVKNQLEVGGLVECDHRRLVGRTLEVLKINRTKARVRDVEGGMIYTVPMNILSPVVTS